jgi:hypothetical protein
MGILPQGSNPNDESFRFPNSVFAPSAPADLLSTLYEGAPAVSDRYFGETCAETVSTAPSPSTKRGGS